MPWSIEPLAKNHVIDAFDCGEPSLDDYLKRFARQNIATGLGRTFVAVEVRQSEVCGYFTMAAGAVRFDTIPDHLKRRLPRYPIPTAHLAKLAVHRAHQGRGLGAALLIATLQRAAQASEYVGIFAVDVIALNDGARNFYLKYGFVPLLDNPNHLYMNIQKARALAKLSGSP